MSSAAPGSGAGWPVQSEPSGQAQRPGGPAVGLSFGDPMEDQGENWSLEGVPQPHEKPGGGRSDSSVLSKARIISSWVQEENWAWDQNAGNTTR